MRTIKKLALMLVIIGVVVCLVPVFGHLYTKYQQDKMMSEWLNGDDAAAAAPETSVDPEEAYAQLQGALAEDAGAAAEPEETTGDPSTGASQEPFTTQSAVTARKPSAVPSTVVAPKPSAAQTAKPSEPMKQRVLGVIQIEKIEVNVPIVEGVKAANLKVGIGHFPGTALPGAPGNCSLAGHRSYTFGKFFNRLDEIVEGDEILITTKTEQLRYKVSKKFVVLPDDVSILAANKDQNMITLITCTPIYVASHRLIVQADLAERTPKE